MSRSSSKSQIRRSFDLGVKLKKYAGAGIPEYWVIDLRSDRAHLFAEPRGGKFTESRIAAFDEVVSPREYPDVQVALAAVFGR